MEYPNVENLSQDELAKEVERSYNEIAEKYPELAKYTKEVTNYLEYIGAPEYAVYFDPFSLADVMAKVILLGQKLEISSRKVALTIYAMIREIVVSSLQEQTKGQVVN